MTFGGFQTTWGKIYKCFPLKILFILAMFIFEVGSLICAVAPGPNTLIAGRAVAGLGAAALSAGILTIIGFVARPELRIKLFGLVGATYGVAGVSIFRKVYNLLTREGTRSLGWRCFHRPRNLAMGMFPVQKSQWLILLFASASMSTCLSVA
jgi:MFS family permease